MIPLPPALSTNYHSSALRRRKPFCGSSALSAGAVAAGHCPATLPTKSTRKRRDVTSVQPRKRKVVLRTDWSDICVMDWYSTYRSDGWSEDYPLFLECLVWCSDLLRCPDDRRRVATIAGRERGGRNQSNQLSTKGPFNTMSPRRHDHIKQLLNDKLDNAMITKDSKECPRHKGNSWHYGHRDWPCPTTTDHHGMIIYKLPTDS